MSKILLTLKYKTMKKVTAGRFVISKSKTKKHGYFTEMVVYKKIKHGKMTSETRHERILS
jgi:hypothetical protein